MIANVKVRCSNGVLVLQEPLDLEEGKEVVVSIKHAPLLGSATARSPCWTCSRD